MKTQRGLSLLEQLQFSHMKETNVIAVYVFKPK